MRFAVILAAHFTLDFYGAILPAILGVVEARCHLDPEHQTPFVMVTISLVAGASQPLFAMLSDRFDSRIYGGLGVLLMGVSACAIGFTDGYGSLLGIVFVGYLGAGMFHPITASSLGQLSRRRRSVGMSWFFMLGMVGAAFGSYWAPRYVVEHDLKGLIYFAPSAVVVAILLHLSIRRIPHRDAGHREIRFDPAELAVRWRMVGLLYAATVLRSLVYTMVQFMYVRWVQAHYHAAHPEWGLNQVADTAAPWVGDLNSLTILGMGVGGLGAGALVATGKERWFMTCVPMVFAPALYWLPSHGYQVSCCLSFLGGIGFGSLAPLALSVAQRLLPHRTSLASALMLGGAWAIGSIGPQIAQWVALRVGVDQVFQLAAGLLFVSGMLGLPLRILPTDFTGSNHDAP